MGEDAQTTYFVILALFVLSLLCMSYFSRSISLNSEEDVIKFFTKKNGQMMTKNEICKFLKSEHPFIHGFHYEDSLPDWDSVDSLSYSEIIKLCRKVSLVRKSPQRKKRTTNKSTLQPLAIPRVRIPRNSLPKIKNKVNTSSMDPETLQKYQDRLAHDYLFSGKVKA